MTRERVSGERGAAEWRLLRACARTRLGTQHSERMRRLLHERIDWTRFISEVSRHRIEPLAKQNLCTTCRETIPAAVRTSLESLATPKNVEALRNVGQALQLIGLFESAGLTAIPYKGPALAAMAYGDLALRSFADAEFVVPQRDLTAAARLLIDRGYQAGPDPTAVGEMRFQERFHPNQYCFWTHSNMVPVKLHTENTFRYLPRPLDWAGMERRSVRVTIGGREVRAFSAEDTLVLLAVHGTRHYWERLCWVCDIAELAQAQPRLDWERSEKLAHQAGCGRMWLLGISLAKGLLDAPVPPAVHNWIGSDKHVTQLHREVEGRLTGKIRTVRSAPTKFSFRLRSYERFGVGIRQCLRTATHATEEDRYACQLPDYALPLYRILRPARLLFEHGLGIRPRPLPDLATYIPTPHRTIDGVLRFAALKPGDMLYDLGCGDGRIVIAAAERFGVHAVGIDIDARRIAEARSNARRSGVEHLVKFRQEDALSTDLGPATVVNLYLSASGTLALSKKLQTELRPGARIISRDAVIAGWNPSRTKEICAESTNQTSTLYEWCIPARPDDRSTEDSSSVEELTV